MTLRPRLPFAGLVLGAIAGILSAEYWPVGSTWALAASCIIGIATWMWPRAWTAILFTAAAFFFLHTIRFLESPAHQLALEFEGSRTIDVEGIVWDEPRTLVEGESTFLLRATVLGETLRDAGFIRVRTVGETPGCGDRVRIRGVAHPPRPPRNPAEFDQAKWSARQGTGLELRCEAPQDAEIVARAEGRAATRAATNARVWIRGQLAAGIPASADEVALIESMVLGVNAETPLEMRDLFQKTGTLHLLAVSGLNVAMLAGIVLKLFKTFRIHHTPAVVLTILCLAGYALVTGLSPSCTRAAIMAAFLLSAPCFDRSASALNSLAAAAFTLLAWDTNQLFSVGFQLSFVIVLVIFLVAGRLQDWVAPWANPDEFVPRELWSPGQRLRVWTWRAFAAALAVNLASWAGSLVFMAGYFHLISPASIVANFIAVVLAFFVLALGIASILAAFVQPVAILFNHANVLCAGALLKVIAAFATIPGGYVYVELPHRGPDPACELTVLDMDEGAATHVRSGSSDWLIDAGALRDYSHTLVPYLRSRGINRLGTILLTHGDAAHIGGAVPLLREFEPLNWIEGRPVDRSPTRRLLHAALNERNIGRSLCAAGDRWKLGAESEVRVLFPPADLDRSLADDQAVVILITSHGRRILLMSDAGFFTEQWLMEHEPELRADVVIKGWHDREKAAAADFIIQVAPRLVIAGAPDFGTRPEALDAWAAALREKGITLFSQTNTGAVRIEIRSDGTLKATSQIPGTPDFLLPAHPAN